MRTVTIRIEEDVDERLQRLASETHRPKSFYVREALLEHLDEIEDVYLAEKRLEAIRSGSETTIPLEEVMHRYEVEDRREVYRR
ncbi:MAG TPA: CopG family transcriptional regulator [Geobacter sp.]|nr:CopG family transcriptional regulator [Geobacter sp.]